MKKKTTNLKMTKKTTNRQSSIVTAAKEMLAFAKGEVVLPSYTYAPPSTVDVVKIRKELGFTQQEFANHYGFAVSALRDWEQGRRNPERSARILLTLIATDPKLVEKTLTRLI